MEPYYLNVEGILVKVMHKGEERKKETVDESELLKVLQEKKTEAKSEGIQKPPKGFMEDLVEGKIETLIEFVKKHELSVCLKTPRQTENDYSKYNSLDLIHLCAIGGYSKSLDYLLNKKRLRQKTWIFDSTDRSCLAFGAIRGNTDILNIVDIPIPKGCLKTLEDISKRCKNPNYLMKAKRKFDKNAASNAQQIPSLLAITSNVLGSEILLSPVSPLTRSLSLLPSKLFDMVCEKISKDEKGTEIFDYIEKEMKIKVPISARIDAAAACEQRTRDFTYRTHLLDKSTTQPLIDVFDEIDSFEIQPQDELEESSARFFPSSRVADTPSIVSKRQFLKQFRALTGGFFDGFDFSNAVVLGGSVVGALLPVTPSPLAVEEHVEDDENNEEGEDREDREDTGPRAPTTESNSEKDREEGEDREDTGPRAPRAPTTESNSEKDNNSGNGDDDNGYNDDDDDGYKENERRESREKYLNREKIFKTLTSSITLPDYYSKVSPFKGSDIDIYIYGVTAEEFAKKVEYIYSHLQKFVGSEKHILVAKSYGSVVFIPHHPYRTVQIVIREFTSIWQLLTGVDIDCSAFAFDGTKLWTTQRGRYAMNYRWSVANPDLFVIRGTPSYETRLLKYARRGFSIVDREFNKRYDSVFDRYENVRDYHLQTDNYTPSFYGSQLIAAAEKWESVCETIDSIGKQSAIPYGPNVSYNDVISFLEDAADLTDEGYGPSDSCLQECDIEDVLAFIRNQALLPEDPFTPPFWYQQVNEEEY